MYYHYYFLHVPNIKEEEVSPLMLIDINKGIDNIKDSRIFGIIQVTTGVLIITKPFITIGFEKKYPEVKIDLLAGYKKEGAV